MVLVSALAAVIGVLAALIAYVLYNLIGFFTNIAFYHRLSWNFVSPRYSHLGLLGHRDSRDRRAHCGHHGEVRLVQDSRPWHSGGDGSGADQPQPH